MNESFPADVKEPGEAARKPGSGLTWLALLLALVSLAGSGWLWWQGQGKAKTTADLSAEAARQSQTVSGLESRLAALESRMSGMAAVDPMARLGDLEQALKSLQAEAAAAKSFQDQTAAWTRSMQAAIEGDQARLTGAEARLATLSARSMSAAAELDLAEIDYLLRLAQERLLLFGDSRTAMQALQIAAQHVQAFDNPLYLGLSSEITLALQNAAQVNAPDYPALYSKLDGLQNLVASMPLKGSEPVAAPAEQEARGWWARLRSAFAGLVTVRRTTALEDGLPLLADQPLIRQQAWLELEVARLAAMRRDQPSWNNTLDRFTAVLDRWFDAAGSARAQAGSLLDVLKSLDVDPELPDIGGPLKALQA
ncbi:MAG: uroporphyrinogen-III C-methyltransferase, partial [Lysobacterales bacterium]